MDAPGELEREGAPARDVPWADPMGLRALLEPEGAEAQAEGEGDVGAEDDPGAEPEAGDETAAPADLEGEGASDPREEARRAPVMSGRPRQTSPEASRSVSAASGVPEVGPSHRRALEGLREALARSAGLQFALLVGAGIAILVTWTAIDRAAAAPRGAQPASARETVRPFPKLDVKGADPVREEDVEALLKQPRAGKGAPTAGGPRPGAGRDVAAEEGGPGPGTVLLKPGQVVNEDGFIVSDPTAAPARGEGRVPSGRHVEVAGPTHGGRFFAPGGLLAMPASKRGDDASLGLQVGDRFKVRLEVGVVSSTHEDVLASVVEDVVRDGRRVLRKGDILRGQASSTDKRILVRFRSVESGGHPLSMSGYAVDGQMPGIVAHRREATVEERSRGQATRNAIAGAAEEASEILAGATAVGRIAGRVASGAASEAERAAEPDRSWVLEVPAGRTFEVVITEAAR